MTVERAPLLCTPSATRIRWRIVGLLFLISVVTYIDRVNISVTARQMMPVLGLSDVDMGRVFSAFVLGYALCQIPGGWLSDRWGPRLVLTAAVVWWSVFTAMTAVAAVLPVAAWGGALLSLMLVRFLVGVGEAAALPTFNRAVANWLPQRERGRGIGIAIGGIGVGSAITPPVTAWIMVNWGWQVAFHVAALLGLLVAAVWWWYATDHPSTHPRVNAAERALIVESAHSAGLPAVASPWRAVVRRTSVWWLILSYTCLGYVAYVYLSWFYLYLVNVRGFTELRGAFFTSLPFLAMAVSCPVGGWLTDRLVTSLGVPRGRQVVGVTGMGLAAVSILIGAFTDSPTVAILTLSLGAGWLYFPVGAYWTSTVDMTAHDAGRLSGLMNTGANVGGIVSPMLTPWLAREFGWAVALAVAAAVALLGGLLWLLVRPIPGSSR